LTEHLSDEVIREARLGRPESVARLCVAHYAKVLKYMRYRVDAAAAEDLTNEVFLRVLRHLGEQKGSFAAWLYRIAGNVVTDHIRARATRRETPLEVEPVEGVRHVETPPAALDRQTEIEKGLAALTDEQRELVTLKFIQGLSNAEIAEVTGRSAEAVRGLQFRALKALREALERRGEGEDHDT